VLGDKPLIVVLAVPPVVVTPPGALVIVHEPLGNPLNTTLPVGVVHVGCVMVPIVGADGSAFTVIVFVEEQPVALSVKVSTELPAVTPVTTPVLVIDTLLLLLLQVPPVLGVTIMVPPTQTALAPPKVGLADTALIATFDEVVEVHELLFVTVNV
jgi:hypothetical protein